MPVNIIEIDNSQPTQTTTYAGTPAAVIGTAESGPAFVPTLSNSEGTWANIHGTISSTWWGSVAVKAWYHEAQANASLIYVRVLGAGDGKKRDGTTNKVNRAGYVVGEKQVQTQEAADAAKNAGLSAVTVGYKGHNPFANQVFAQTADAALVVTSGADTVIPTGDGGIVSLGTDASTGGIFVKTTSRGDITGATITLNFPTGFVDASGDQLQSHTIVLREDDDVSVLSPSARQCFVSISNGGGGNLTGGVADVAQMILQALKRDTSFDPDGDLAGSYGSKTYAKSFKYGSGWQLASGTASGDPNSVFIATIVNTSGVKVQFRGSQTANSGNYAANWGFYGGPLVTGVAGTWMAITAEAVSNSIGNATGTSDAHTAGTTTSSGGTAAATVTATDGTTTTVYTANKTAAATDFIVGPAATTAANLMTALISHDGFTGTAAASATQTLQASVAGTGPNTTHKVKSSVASWFTWDSSANVADTYQTLAGANESSGAEGRTYFLSTIMSQSEGSSYLTDAGLHGVYQPILRGVLLVASGVECTLSGWNPRDPGGAALTGSAYAWGATGNGKNAGNHVGALRKDNYSTKLIFNGLKDAASRVVEVSFDSDTHTEHLSGLNTLPEKFEELGHILYANYPVPSVLAVPSEGSVLHNYTATVDGVSRTFYHNVLLTTGSADRNTYGASGYTPNYEGWEDRFQTPFTPWVISQPVGGVETKLFRLHALDDGQGAEDRYYCEISNIQYPTTSDEYAKFDLTVKSYGTSTTNQTQPNPGDNGSGEGVLNTTHTNLTLDPNDTNYIARVIGDYHRYFNFDVDVDEQKLVLAGTYENSNKYYRVEVSDDVANGLIDKTLIPFGYQGIHHLVTSGSSAIGNGMLSPIEPRQVTTAPDGSIAEIFPIGLGELTGSADYVYNAGQGMVQPPVPMRRTIKQNAAATAIYPWGMRFDKPEQGTLYSDKAESSKVSLTGDSGDGTQVVKNSNDLWSRGMDLIRQLNRFFPSYASSAMWAGNNAGKANTSEGAVLDGDAFNLNKFSLSKVYVATQTVGSVVRPDADRWHNAYYIRNGVDPSTSGFRFLQASDLKSTFATQNYAKFILPFQGGFDGLNIFNANKYAMNHHAAHYEQVDKSNQGGLLGPTVASYRKAIDILSEKTDVDINCLAIPNQRSSFVTDHAADAMEDRFDAIYLMDVEVCGADGSDDVMFMDKDDQKVNTFYTIERFAARGLDNSFAAAYYPNTTLRFLDSANIEQGKAENAPASIAALAAFAQTERREGAWGTPAGYDNGRISAGETTQVDLTTADVSDLYVNRINPLVSYNDPNHSEMATGQDTEVDGDLVVQGQKTLLLGDSALSRLDVRKLMVYIRRETRKKAESFLFEPNQPGVLADFSAEVETILQDLVAAGAVEQYRVVIDETTTTQADIENNTVRGKVFVKPYRSIEIVSIDISLENNGAF